DRDAAPIAIIGAGSVGLMLAGHLAEAGWDVVVCGRAPLDRVVVTLDGATVEHKVDWAAEPAELPPLRHAVLATKIHHTPDVAGWLGALPAGSAVVAAQNGVDHRARIEPLTAAVVVPTLVYPNAERTAPGLVRVRRTGRGLVVPDDDGGRRRRGCSPGAASTWRRRPTSAPPPGRSCCSTSSPTRSPPSPGGPSRCSTNPPWPSSVWRWPSRRSG